MALKPVLSGLVQVPTDKLPAGGLTGEELVKNSNADYDVKWAPQASTALVIDGTSVTGGPVGVAAPLVVHNDTLTYYQFGTGGYNVPLLDSTGNLVLVHNIQGLTFNGNTLANGTGTITTNNHTLSLSANATIGGTNTGDQTSVTGNAGTATALATPRAINGVNFDGTAAITVTAAAATLTGTTLASGVTGSSLTGFGTITSGTLSTGLTIQLSNVSYTGAMSGSNVSGGTFGAVNGSALTNLSATNIATGILASTAGGTGVNNAGTLTNASNTTITGGGTIALGGFTATVPATGTVVIQGGALGTPSSGVATNLTGTAASLTAGNATKWTTGRTIALTGDVTYTSPSLDGSGNVTAAATLVATSNTTLTSLANLVTVGTLTGGATGAGFTVALTTSTITGNLPDARNTVSNSTTTTMSALATIGASGVTTTIPGPVTMTKGTASTTTGTGTLVVTGGVGVSGQVTTGGAVKSAGGFYSGGKVVFGDGGTDGFLFVSNIGLTSLTRAQWGGVTSSFPALLFSGTTTTVGLADGTSGGSLVASGTFAVTSTSTFTGKTTHTAGIDSADNITTTVAGKTLFVKSGTNAKAGTFTLIAGVATVTNTSITANSVIAVTLKTLGGTRTGNPDIVPTATTGFVATGGVADTSTYNFIIMEVN